MNITITIPLLEDSEGVCLDEEATLTAGNGCMRIALTNPERHITIKMVDMKNALQILMAQGEGR